MQYFVNLGLVKLYIVRSWPRLSHERADQYLVISCAQTLLTLSIDY